ncbi:MAG: SMC family ATPase [Nanoarchaeota archaeon]|nr:SMC family ATPase [Nanoarchaeota archaeon]
MITKVSLTNWRSHLQSELEFCEGTNCLVGRMGSGKSSVLDAICFGLFGTFPQLQQKKIKLEDMIMKKPKQQRFAEVKIFFDSNGDELSVKRRIEKGKSTTAEFRKNGGLVEMQPQKVTEEVEKALKIDYDLFTRAVYSEQNQLDMFLTIPKGQRMKKIDELLRLDRFESARLSAVSLKNRFALHREEKEKTLESMDERGIKTDIETLKTEAEALKKEREFLISESGKALEKKNLLKGKIESLEKIRDEMRNIAEKISLLENINGHMSSDISLIEAQLARAPSESDLDRLEREMEALKNKINSASRDIGKKRELLLGSRLELGTERDRLSQSLKLEEEKKRLDAALEGGKAEKTKSELAEISERLGERTADTGSLKMEIAGCDFASVLKDKCLVCGHELSEEKRRELVSESRKKMETLIERKARTEEEIKTLIIGKRNLEKAASELELAETRRSQIGNPAADIETAKRKMEALSRITEDAEKEIQKMEKDAGAFQPGLEALIREYESAKTSVEKKSEMEKKRKTLENNIGKIGALKTELERTMETFSEAELKEAREKMESLIGAEKSIEAKIRFMEDLISEKRKRFETAESRKKIAGECALEIRKAAAMEEQLQLLERGLEVSQERLRKDFIGAINHAMRMLWENLYPYADFFSARIAIDGDYVLQVQDSNGWTSIDNVSGGERSIACLALRMAFALVLAPQLRWLVLDEPTHNLDEKAVAELANVLHDNITEFVEQAFLITHDPALESAVFGFLYRMEKEKEGFTNVVKVEGE